MGWRNLQPEPHWSKPSMSRRHQVPGGCGTGEAQVPRQQNRRNFKQLELSSIPFHDESIQMQDFDFSSRPYHEVPMERLDEPSPRTTHFSRPLSSPLNRGHQRVDMRAADPADEPAGSESIASVYFPTPLH